MLLVAQRVVSAGNPGVEGINAYRYSHPGLTWPQVPDASLKETEHKILDRKVLNVDSPGGGNRIRSYLDVLAPDGFPQAVVQPSFHGFLIVLANRWQFPEEGCFGEIGFAFYADPGLTPMHEANLLYQQLLWS